MKYLLYETYFDNLQPYLGRENLQLHYMDFDSFVFSIRTQNIFDDLKNLVELFDFSNLKKTKNFPVNSKMKFLRTFG